MAEEILPFAAELVPGETCEATVARTLFTNPDSGFAVVRVRGDAGATFTAIGPLLGVREGDRLRLAGRWVEHPRFGRQLEVSTYVYLEPSTKEGIRRFLASGRIRGIGPKMAERIVARFGDRTLEIIEREPEKLRRVRGIGAKTLDRIRTSWEASRGLQQIMVFLTGHGLPPGVAVKAHARYGAAAVDVVRSNPYRLAEEVFGVGFRTADRIARGLGLAEDAPERLRAGLVFVLEEAALDGHVYLPRRDLLTRAAQLLGTGDDILGPPLESLAAAGRVVVEATGSDEDDAVYLDRLHGAEVAVAEGLEDVMEARRTSARLDVASAVAWYERRADLSLAPAQREALAAALTEPAVIITGGPGTGKTTLVRGVIEILGRKDERVLLAAPTGRAAKRLSETTGTDARTIHRLLEFNPATRAFGRNADHPLEADLLVVDEVSMVDVDLAAALLAATPPACRMVLVGDADQLPSVGPGNVLADLIASGRLRVIRLEQIFRQARRSLIVDNAHRINHGAMPVSGRDDEPGDFYFVARDDVREAADLVIDFVAKRIPRRFGLDPVDDIQVLAPMHRGELGVANLNQRLQELLTPPGPELVSGSRHFRPGDKVMQLRNNYELDIYNGDLGRVVNVDREERELVVRFDGRPVILGPAELEEVTPAFACTIHKAQGSEYPAVVIALHHSHHLMLQRNLLYTAVTRGRRLVVIVGSRRALGRAVHNATVQKRYTRLAQRLRDACA